MNGCIITEVTTKTGVLIVGASVVVDPPLVVETPVFVDPPVVDIPVVVPEKGIL